MGGKETVYRLVHSSVTVTMDRYAHVLPDQSAEYIDKASEHLKNIRINSEQN